MSAGSINSTINFVNANAPAVFDLLAAQPSSEQGTDFARVDAADVQGPRGFEDALREATGSETRSANEGQAEDVDTRSVRDESAGDEQASTDERGDGEAGGDSDTAGESGSAEQRDTQDRDSEQAQASTDSEAETQASAVAGQDQASRAASQQLALNGSLSTADLAEQLASATQQTGNVATDQQAQAAALQANIDAANRVQTQAATDTTQGPGQDLLQVSLQQGTQAETGNGEARSDTQATAQAATASSATTNGTTSGAVFTLAGQASVDANLPLNQTGAAQQADGARATTFQPLTGQASNDAVNTARVSRGLSNAVQQGGGAVTLRLTPPDLGTVRIQLQITGTNVSANFHAETSSAQTLLTQQLAQLRSALETQGLNVERLNVQPLASANASQNASQNNNDNQQQNQNQAQQQQSTSDGRSREQYAGDGGRSQEQGNGDSDSNRANTAGFFEQLGDAADDAA